MSLVLCFSVLRFFGGVNAKKKDVEVEKRKGKKAAQKRDSLEKAVDQGNFCRQPAR